MPFELPLAKDEFASDLLHWYERNRRELPWRSNPDPYWVWLSEIMLQQTQVKAALPYFRKFVTAYPRIEDLAQADINEVLSNWSGLGYYSRARNLHKAAGEICRRHGGRFPHNFDEVIALPGVGRYTAGAVLSIAFGQPLPIVDGNVRRVMARFLRIESEIKGKTLEQLWETLSQCVASPEARRRASDFNQALMELGALVCTPRNPQCGNCPLNRTCRAYASGTAEDLPVRTAKRKVEEWSFHVAVASRGTKFLLKLNQEESFLRGFWEFPRVSCQEEAQLRDAFGRVHGIRLRKTAGLSMVRHQITFRKLSFHPFLAELESPLPKEGFAWAELGDSAYPVPAYVRKIERAAASARMLPF